MIYIPKLCQSTVVVTSVCLPEYSVSSGLQFISQELTMSFVTLSSCELLAFECFVCLAGPNTNEG